MKVLFVCAGNICRSPMAEALFRYHAAFEPSLLDVTTASAGVIAADGHGALQETVDVLRSAFGVDAGAHRARRLLANEKADLVLTLDDWVHERVLLYRLAGTVGRLAEYAGFPGEEVADPYGAPIDTYRETGALIDKYVRAAVRRLARERQAFDLDAYRRRIGHDGPVSLDVATLQALHRAHAAAIPFENLDVQWDVPIRLDLASLQSKLVAARRGGYCFEQNTLFAAALRAVGFDAIACEARVRQERGTVLPRTHMVLVVTLDDRRWLCDVGFGGDGPFEPVALDGTDQEQGPWRYRSVEEREQFVLQTIRDEVWTDLYAFVPEPRYPIDFEVTNWFTSTHPRSAFVTNLTVQRRAPERRAILRNLQLATSDATGTRTREIARDELVHVLRDEFELEVPAEATFKAIDGEEYRGATPAEAGFHD